MPEKTSEFVLVTFHEDNERVARLLARYEHQLQTEQALALLLCTQHLPHWVCFGRSDEIALWRFLTDDAPIPDLFQTALKTAWDDMTPAQALAICTDRGLPFDAPVRVSVDYLDVWTP